MGMVVLKCRAVNFGRYYLFYFFYGFVDKNHPLVGIYQFLFFYFYVRINN